MFAQLKGGVPQDWHSPVKNSSVEDVNGGLGSYPGCSYDGHGAHFRPQVLP